MSKNTRTSAQSVAPRSDASKKKPIRFKIGVGLLIFYPFMYLIIPIAPFLPIDAALKVALIAAILGAAEGVFLLGVACVGKEAFQAIKAKLGLGKKKRAKEEAARLAAEAAEIAPPTGDDASGSDASAAVTNSLERTSKYDHV